MGNNNQLGDIIQGIQTKRQLKRAEVASKLEDKRAKLRESMPGVANVVDQFRKVFGEGVAVIAASEGGRVVRSSRAMRRFSLTDEEVML